MASSFHMGGSMQRRSRAMKFECEADLHEYISERLQKIQELFDEVIAAEESFYGYSPSKEQSDAMQHVVNN